MDDVSEKVEGISKEAILGRWIESGFNRDAVAAFGTSIENLERILKTGQIPSFETRLPYQEKLVKGGKSLYYTFPTFNKTRRMSLEHYAQYQAIRHCFFKQTGIDLERYDILALAFEFLTREFLIEYLRLNGNVTDDEIHGELDWVELDKDKLTAVKSQIDSDSLKRILSSCLKRKGVITYLNSNIFRYQIEAGKEDEEELLIVSDRPLSISNISGIEVLSSADKSALGL